MNICTYISSLYISYILLLLSTPFCIYISRRLTFVYTTSLSAKPVRLACSRNCVYTHNCRVSSNAYGMGVCCESAFVKHFATLFLSIYCFMVYLFGSPSIYIRLVLVSINCLYFDNYYIEWVLLLYYFGAT